MHASATDLDNSCVTIPGNILRLCQYSWHNPASGSSREEPKKRRRTCTIGDAWNGHIGKRLVTREDPLPGTPDSRACRVEGLSWQTESAR